MPKIIVLKPFKFAHGGTQVEEFEPHPQREPRDATQELIEHDGLVGESYIEIVESGDADDAHETEQVEQAAEQAAETTPSAVTTKTAAPARKTAAKKAG